MPRAPRNKGKTPNDCTTIANTKHLIFDGLVDEYTQKIQNNSIISKAIGGGNATAVEPSLGCEIKR
jgi:hypothetical protein